MGFVEYTQEKEIRLRVSHRRGHLTYFQRWTLYGLSGTPNLS